MPRIARTLCAVAGLAVVVTGCSSDELEPSVAGFADSTAISQEYEDASSSLELPDGQKWPSVSFGGEAYSTGYGTERAYEIWQCEWMTAALEDGADVRAAGLEKLSDYIGSEQFDVHASAQRHIYEEAVTGALDGSDGDLEQLYEATCDGVLENLG